MTAVWYKLIEKEIKVVNAIEYVCWGLAPNNQEWQEELIASRPTMEALKPAIEWAKSKGFKVRVSVSDIREAPDFVKCLNIN